MRARIAALAELSMPEPARSTAYKQAQSSRQRYVTSRRLGQNDAMWVVVGAAMKIFRLGIVLASMLPSSVMAQATRPVLVELFTSEGCSSCPPADSIVATLARTRPDLLALTFHVTYWNYLGWHDPFSFEGATDRQQHYVQLGISPDVYTPALVIDGRRDVVGSNEAGINAGLAAAKTQLRDEAKLEVAREAQTLSISIAAGRGHGKVLLVGFDLQHRTPVGRGENGGRTLLEANIVRSLTTLGTWNGEAMRLRAAVPAGEQDAIIVQAEDGAILGAQRVASATG